MYYRQRIMLNADWLITDHVAAHLLLPIGRVELKLESLQRFTLGRSNLMAVVTRVGVWYVVGIHVDFVG